MHVGFIDKELNAIETEIKKRQLKKQFNENKDPNYFKETYIYPLILTLFAIFLFGGLAMASCVIKHSPINDMIDTALLIILFFVGLYETFTALLVRQISEKGWLIALHTAISIVLNISFLVWFFICLTNAYYGKYI